ncbi:MAG TPA: tetratricopeptide repeat protein [Tepidisphaeraceae bacterium]|jgi:tetratricopeptide (TPR) repeat protein
MASKYSALLGPKEGASVLLQYLAEAAYLWSYFGKPDEAKTIFEGLMLLAPADPVAPLGLAEIYLSQGKFREADKAAETASRMENADRRTVAFAYKLRGRSLMQLNKAREAGKFWQRAVEIDKDGPEGKSAATLLQMAREMGLVPTEAP